MLTIEQILNLAEECGIGIETESSHSGIFYEEQDGTVYEIEMSDLFFESHLYLKEYTADFDMNNYECIAA